MKKRVLAVIIVFLTSGLFISDTTFAAWTQAKGHAYNQLTLSYFKSKDLFSSIENEAGVIEKIKQPKYVDYKLSYYGEYGVTDTLTAILSVPYVWIESEEVHETIGEDGPSGIGDIEAGVRYKLSDNIGFGVLMSLQGIIKIPEAYDYEDPVTFQNIGEGQYDGTLSLVFGRGFNWGYTVINAGYKYRFENNQLESYKPSDQIKLRIDAGYGLHPKLSLRGNLEWAKSVGNASISRGIRNAYIKAFGGDRGDEEKIIKDTLSLEPDNLALGVALAYSVTSKIQAVLSYNTVVSGIGTDLFRTKDSGYGNTYAAAIAYVF